MRQVLLGTKAGMTQIYDDHEAVPVTAIESPDCVLVMKRIVNGTPSVQLGFDETDKLNQALTGHFEAHGVTPRRVVQEFIVDEDSPLVELEEGSPVGPDLFEEGQRVDVQGPTRGKGFTGAMKRHGFSGGPSTHGGGFGRSTGSVGQAADPSRIFPGKKMPGRAGNDTRTVQNLTVMRVYPDDGVLLVSGSVPGIDGALLVVHDAAKGERNHG